MKESDDSSSSNSENENNENPLQESNNSGEVGNDLKYEERKSNQNIEEEGDKSNQKEVSENNIYDIKIIIVGEIGVGKTSVIRRYLTNNFIEEERSSIACKEQEKSIELDSETKVNLKIIDTAGEEKYGPLTNLYFKDCQGAIVMYDLTDKNSFNKIDNWLSILKEKAAKKIVIMLAGNKSDLIDKKVNLGDELNLYKEKYDHLEISAKEGNNVDIVFKNLVNKIVDILKNKGEHSIIKRRNTKTLQPDKKKKKNRFKELLANC